MNMTKDQRLKTKDQRVKGQALPAGRQESRKKTVKLPREFKRYFWDVDFKKLVLKPFSRHVLERLMNFGDFRVFKWLLRIVPKEKIIEVVKKSRELDFKTRNYWKLIYGK